MKFIIGATMATLGFIFLVGLYELSQYYPVAATMLAYLLGVAQASIVYVMYGD